MEGWITALLLKAAGVLVLAFFYWLVIYKGTKALGRIFPEGKLKDFLFRERGDTGASLAPDLDKRLRDDRTV